ncbi:puratrophin-1-like isoform X4 [Vespula maculifrons]|uniref:Puratrophin-1-like isoform X4 n=1 Tax=Vespula maculifrons TaxID=7453 RepID=A0ABD2AQT1_VESMC
MNLIETIGLIEKYSGDSIVVELEMRSLIGLKVGRCKGTSEQTKDGLSLLVLGESNECLDLLDKALILLQGRINVSQAFVLRNTNTENSTNDSMLPLSRVKTIVITDTTNNKFIQRERREGNYDHQQWITFYKEYDGLMSEWHAAGRRLALEMSELKECTSLSGTLTPLGRLLTDPTLRRTSRDAEVAIAALEERATSLLHIDYVKSSLQRARRLMEEVGNAATRLESSFESRRATIRNLAVLRSIEDQAHEESIESEFTIGRRVWKSVSKSDLDGGTMSHE